MLTKFCGIEKIFSDKGPTEKTEIAIIKYRIFE